MKLTQNGITYFIDEVKKMAIIESFQGTYFEEICIPEQINGFLVKQISSRAFHQNKHLKSIVLPDSITRINAEAFCECYFLEKVHFYKGYHRNGRLEIGYRAFASCAKLTSVTSEVSICVCCERDVFYNCVRLKTMQLYLDQIENNCFENCFALDNVLFADCALWKTGTFKGCSDLKNVTFMGDVEELLSDTCMKWISKRNVKCRKNTSIAEFVYSGTHIEFI